jgi:hypothetical protein
MPIDNFCYNLQNGIHLDVFKIIYKNYALNSQETPQISTARANRLMLRRKVHCLL